jgi:hypothetical protein
MCAANRDFDPRFVKPGLKRGSRGNVRHPAGFVQCLPRAHLRVSRSARLQADRSRKFSYAQEGGPVPAALGYGCSVALDGVAIEATRFGSAAKAFHAAQHASTKTGMAFEDAVAEVSPAREPPDARLFARLVASELAKDRFHRGASLRQARTARLFCVTTLRHLTDDLLETQVHCLGVGIRQDRAGIAPQADGAVRATV